MLKDILPGKWILLAGDMRHGHLCYRTPRRTVVVQGYEATAATDDLLKASGEGGIPEGESSSEIPEGLASQMVAVMAFIDSRPAEELRWVQVDHSGASEVWQLAPELQAEAIRGE